MKELRELTTNERTVWWRLAALMSMVPAELDAQLVRDSDISLFSFLVMARLSEAPDWSLRMSDLALKTNGSQSRLSHLVGRLEQQGWVRREKANDDGRGAVAILTEEGYQKVTASGPGHVDRIRSLIFDPLTPEQIDQLGAICEAIVSRTSWNCER